jgi:uncharacterized protein YggU (UPF0235/DUF167 family)
MNIKTIVRAGAAKDAVSFRKDRYHITTREPAQGGRANKAARSLLAAHLGIPEKSLSLLRGKDRPSKLFLKREA